MRRYEPGSWFALSGERAIAIVPPTVGPACLMDLRAALDEGAIGAFIEALAGATGSSVTSLPDFGVAVFSDDETRVAVRGSVAASDELTDEPLVTGVGVTGWVEAVWPAGAEARLDVAGGDQGADLVELWFDIGVVMARSLRVSHDAEAREPRVPRVTTLTREMPRVLAVAPTAAKLADVPAPAPIPAADVPLPPPVVSAAPAPPPPPPPVATAVLASPPQAPTFEDGADPGATLAAPHDDAEQLAADGDEDDFGVWGSTIAVPPTTAALIDSVPSVADMPPVAAPPAPMDQRGDALAAAPHATAEQTHAAAEHEALGDHDGATISVAALRKLQADSTTPSFASAADLALERRGRAIVSTGAVVTLDRNVIVGRTPKATRITGEMPHLVAVPSPQQDISRNHLEIRVTDTVVVAIDLDTTNGSVLHRRGTEPMRLHPGELTVVVSGDVIDLGDGVTMTFEDLP